MGDLFKYLPLIFRLTPYIPQLKQLWEILTPTYTEGKKVAPEVRALVEQFWAAVGPTLAEARKAYPEASPLVHTLVAALAPDLLAAKLPPIMTVRWQQETFNTLGATPKLKITNSLDDATVKAIRDFQTKNGLFVDGSAGIATLHEMFVQLQAKGQNP